MTFGELEVGEFFYEWDSADGVFMLKTSLFMVKGERFNCVTVNASPDEHILEYASFKHDDERVERK